MTSKDSSLIDSGEPAVPVRRSSPARLGLVLVALLLALVTKTWAAEAYYIPSESMEPGLLKGDRILVEKFSYRFSEGPERGDVIVFRDPGGWLSVGPPEPSPLRSIAQVMGLLPKGEHLVKRVIGVPGDVIVCCDTNGQLLLNGEPFDEDAFIDPQTTCDGPMTRTCRWRVGPVPADSVFVMGDNRDDSSDSSVHLCEAPQVNECQDSPFVSTELIVGKVGARFWPLDRLALIFRPDAVSTLQDSA